MATTDSPPGPRPRRWWLPLLAGAITWVAVFSVTTSPLPGLDPDAMSYLGAAKSLVVEGSLQVPVTEWMDEDSTSFLSHFPPGFPLAIAVPIRLGAAPIEGARLVIATAAAVTVTTTSLLVLDAMGLAAAGLLVGIFWLTPALVNDHTSVLSEPLFLACLSLTLTSMVRWPDRPLRFGFFAALGSIVRYSGLSLVGAAALWAFLPLTDWKNGWRRAVIAVLPAIIFDGAWWGLTRVAAHELPVTALSLDLALGPNLREIGETLRDWLAPGLFESRAAPFIAVIALALLAVLWLKPLRTTAAPSLRTRRAFGAIGVLLAGYVGLVITARLVVWKTIPFDWRLLSPVIFLVTTATVIRISLVWRGATGQRRTAIAVAVTTWGVLAAIGMKNEIGDDRSEGLDYGTPEWRESPLVGWVNGDGRRYQIFTNDPSPVYFHAGRPSRDIPLALTADSLDLFRAALRQQRGAMVAFQDSSWTPEAKPDLVASRLHLRLLASFPDGKVWVADSAAGASPGPAPPNAPAR